MIRRMIFIAVLIACFVPSQWSRSSAVTAAHDANSAYIFVEIETTVHPVGAEASEENPNERRWYMSTVAVQPDDVPTYSLIKQKIIPYFSRNVMDPAEKRGVAIDYYDEDVRLSGESSQANFATRAEAEEARNKEIEYRKGQSGNIYSFVLDFGAAKGEETSKPQLIYRDKNQPNYERAKAPDNKP